IPGGCKRKRIFLPDPSPEFTDDCEVPSVPRATLAGLGLEPIDGSDYTVTVHLRADATRDSDPTNDVQERTTPVVRTIFRPAFTRVDCTKGNCSVSYGKIANAEYANAVDAGN